MSQVMVYVREILRLSAFQVLDLLPYILGGVVLGELLKIKSWTRIIYKATSGRPFISCIVASLLGIASPLCTYGTIPVAISLYGAGVPLAALVSFISCSSLLNPQFIIYTYGQIGAEMAIMRIVTVFIVGVVFGLFVLRLPDRLISKNRLLKEKDSSTEEKNTLPNTECSMTGEEILARKDKKMTIGTFIKNCLKSLEYVCFYMLIGVISGVILQMFLPTDTINSLFSADKWYSVITAAILGVPLYQCGGGVIPVIANLLTMGMGYGQALTFFLVGPATNVQSIAAIASIIKPRFVVIYVAILILLSIVMGYIYQPLHDLVLNLL